MSITHAQFISVASVVLVPTSGIGRLSVPVFEEIDQIVEYIRMNKF